MKNMKKRGKQRPLSILLTLCMVLILLSALPTFTALAANTNDDGVVTVDTPWSGTLEDAITSLDGITDALDVHQLYITATVAMDSGDITYLNSMSNLEILDVANTVTVGDVGDSFLAGLEYLTRVTFPATTFGDDTFEECYNLKSASLPKAVTFGDELFDYCYNLESVNLPEATTFGDYAFYECYTIQSINLPKAETFEDDAFEYCYNLQSVNLPKVTIFGNYAFDYCTNLKSNVVNLSNHKIPHCLA